MGYIKKIYINKLQCSHCSRRQISELELSVPVL